MVVECLRQAGTQLYYAQYRYMKGHVRIPLPSYCYAGPGGTWYDTYVTFMYEVGMEGKEVELEGC